MVKCFRSLLLVMAFAVPAMAQDYPLLEIGFGYGNIGSNVLASGRHSGFVTNQAFNLNSWFAIENFLGYYTNGTDPQFGKMNLITNSFGGRVNYRNLGPVFYANAGFGGGWVQFTQAGGSISSMATRFGGGVDIPWKDYFAWKFEVSRMGFHLLDQWNSSTNFTAGIVLKINQ